MESGWVELDWVRVKHDESEVGWGRWLGLVPHRVRDAVNKMRPGVKEKALTLVKDTARKLSKAAFVTWNSRNDIVTEWE